MNFKCSFLFMPTLVCLTIALSAPGCSSDSELTSYQQNLEQYDDAVEQWVGQLVAVVEATQGLQASLALDDDDAAGAAADALASSTDGLLVAVTALEDLESKLKGGTEEEGRITQPLVMLIGVGLVIAGTWAFGKKMKSLSDEMSTARKERDTAAEGVMTNKPGAMEQYTAAKNKMESTGEEAIVEVTTKVTTELVLSPLSPTSAAGLVLKDHLGKKVQEGLKVLSATKGCESGSSSDCKITVQRTDASGRVTIPAGPQTVLVSTKGKARVSIKEVAPAPGQDLEIKRALIPIEEADADNVAANDKGEYDPDETPDGGTPTGGSIAGIFPGEPFNGLQVSYTISGVSAGEPTDLEGFTWARSYEGTLGSGTLTVSGTARAENGYGASLSVNATAGSETASDEAYLDVSAAGGLVTKEFSVSVPIPSGATDGSVTINLVGEYNAGSRAVVISTTFGDGW